MHFQSLIPLDVRVPVPPLCPAVHGCPDRGLLRHPSPLPLPPPRVGEAETDEAAAPGLEGGRGGVRQIKQAAEDQPAGHGGGRATDVLDAAKEEVN